VVNRSRNSIHWTGGIGFGLAGDGILVSRSVRKLSTPFAVMIGVPFGILGAFLGLLVLGTPTIVFRRRLLVVIGLEAKNAILMVEFAIEQRHAGRRSKRPPSKRPRTYPADPHDVVRVHPRRRPLSSPPARARRRDTRSVSESFSVCRLHRVGRQHHPEPLIFVRRSASDGGTRTPCARAGTRPRRFGRTAETIDVMNAR